MKLQATIKLSAAIMLLCCTSCHPLRISVNEATPSVFTFDSGRFAHCCEHLAFLTVEEVDPNHVQAKVLWQIWPQSGTDNWAPNLPAITYGQLPKGFEQRVPSVGLPPPLVEGIEYQAIATAAAGGTPSSVRFRIEKGKTVRVLL